MKHSLIFLSVGLSLFTALSPSPGQAPPESDGILTLPQALERALRLNPELAASQHEVQAAEGRTRQAGTLPNPELEIEAEEFGGSDSRKGYDAAQTTVRLSQSLELGGKRAQRRRVAESEARLAGWDHEAKRLDVLAETKKAFVDALLAQGQLALTESLLEVAEGVRRAVAERVKAGKVPLLEETKASVEVITARMARDQAARALATARKQLAATWGDSAPEFQKVDGRLDILKEIPSVDEMAASLEAAPTVARGKEEVALGRESLALARKERIPNVVVSAGLRRFEEDGAYAGVAGFSLPLPLFDRHAGNLLAAEHQALRMEYLQRAARLRVVTELTEACNRLESSRTEALAAQTELIPSAQQAFEAAQAGYREGKFGHLEVLDAQRTLSEAKARYLEALASYHKAAADVERWAGISLNTLQ